MKIWCVSIIAPVAVARVGLPSEESGGRWDQHEQRRWEIAHSFPQAYAIGRGATMSWLEIGIRATVLLICAGYIVSKVSRQEEK